MTELVGVYENSPEDAGRVMELMQKMQACGTPPQEILVRAGFVVPARAVCGAEAAARSGG